MPRMTITRDEMVAHQYDITPFIKTKFEKELKEWGKKQKEKVDLLEQSKYSDEDPIGEKEEPKSMDDLVDVSDRETD